MGRAVAHARAELVGQPRPVVAVQAAVAQAEATLVTKSLVPSSPNLHSGFDMSFLYYVICIV